MKKNTLLIGCCVMTILIFSGCGGAEQKEVPAENKPKNETVSINTASKNAASENSVSASTPAQSPSAIPQGMTATPAPQGGGEAADPPSTAPTEAVPEETDLGQESMQQCPYCGQWFSTEPDGDLWNPYDRHLLEERDSSQSGEPAYEEPSYEETTDGEMVQCPDCGNWYEEGNIFRNHICEGRTYPDEGETADGEMVQEP